MAAPSAAKGPTTRYFLYMLLIVGLSGTMFTMYNLDMSGLMKNGATNHHVRAAAAPRGILICMFDAMIPMTISLIVELRALGYADVIQLYHCNGELSVVSQQMLHETDKHIEIVDGCQEMVATGQLQPEDADGYRSFWLKPLALIHTRLDDVILMDADDLVFQNPARLFDVPEYKSTGTIFFYDREILKKEYLNNYFDNEYNLHELINSFDYAKYGLEKNPSRHVLTSLAWHGDSAHEQDSSIVAIKKSKAPLAITVLNQLLQYERHRIGFTYGDKELFWLAWELAQRPYFFSPWANSGAARPGNMKDHPDTICGGLAQFMPLGTDSSELLHINGGYIFNPYSNNNINSMTNATERLHQLLADVPSHVSKRRTRSKALNKPEDDKDPHGWWAQECLLKRGSEPIRPQDIEAINQRIRNAVRVASEQQNRLKRADAKR
ncbi:Aste57867_15913 [Aphanomyces stellatus]|uniref:Aste57867_15913 protein n=1 Tax=Aphanomyces stellatus TaxID=120398 RepID=A0A485L7D2_9STRA|nr:hypothetical protein As57867_015857 [Aphanomyces stellatus]VFT92699.1 Aste57867_15913 [Aphanomyces stellatus]